MTIPFWRLTEYGGTDTFIPFDGKLSRGLDGMRLIPVNVVVWTGLSLEGDGPDWIATASFRLIVYPADVPCDALPVLPRSGAATTKPWTWSVGWDRDSERRILHIRFG
jgi:hypothetical protein